MITEQLTVFVANKVGYLSEITGLLAEEGINMKALSIADTKDFGILRIIVDDTERAFSALKEHDILCAKTEVLAVKIPNRAGALYKTLDVLAKNNVNVEYLYAFLSGEKDGAEVVIKVSDNAAAAEIIKNSGLTENN